MYLIHAGFFTPEEDDDNSEEQELLEESIVFCGKEENIEKSKKFAIDELSEEPDFVNVYNLEQEDDREEALDKLSLVVPYFVAH